MLCTGSRTEDRQVQGNSINDYKHRAPAVLVAGNKIQTQLNSMYLCACSAE